MKNAAVVIDSWKLKIFKKYLDDSGYTYTEHNGPTKDTLLLSVKTDQIATLKPIVENAAGECARWKKNQKLN